MRKPAPKINHPYVFSVSQAQTFRLCKRKWAYLKIDGIEDPGNEASHLGGVVHGELEEYLEHGKPIGTGRPGKIAMSALPHLPPPRYPGMRIEDWFHVKVGEAYYRGLKDVEIIKGWKNPGIPFVSDHKTTKNFMWSKTEEDLTGGETEVGDVQAGLYAYDTMLRTGSDLVDLQWTYMRTTGASHAEPRCAIINRKQVDRIIHELELTTVEMILTKREHPTASTVEQDPTACGAFGGCPYTELCNLTPKDRLKAMMTQKSKEGVLGKLAARKAAKEAGASSAAATPKKAEEPKAAPVAEPEETETETESTTSEVNPPENAIAPVVTGENEEEIRGKKGKSAKGPKVAPAAAKAPVVSTGGSVIGRAMDAFWGVLVDDLATRIAEKLQK